MNISVPFQVVGLPDERWGEQVCAVIIKKPGAQLDAQEVKDFCRGKIAHFKVPEFVMFEEESFLPLTPTGKVQKFVLAERCAKKLGKEGHVFAS